MRHVLIAAALLTAAACSDDATIDPAWVTPGTAGECGSGGSDLPANMSGSYAAPWQCRGAGADGDVPCDPDANPLIHDDTIALTTAGSGYTLAVADRQIPLTLANPTALIADAFEADGYSVYTVITTCAEGKMWLAVSVAPIGPDDLNHHYAWAATLTRL